MKDCHNSNSDSVKQAEECRQLLVRLHILEERNRELAEQLALEREQNRQLLSSKSWRLTAPLRFCAGRLRDGKARLGTARQNESDPSPIPYEKLENRLLFSEEELRQQRQTQFPQQHRISLLVPLYNTPEGFLKAMLDSVRQQTYGSWELCLADGSDAQHTYVGKLCLQYAAEDARIRYQRLEKNAGISANTNACIAMSSGDYLGLLDHDDLLHPAALHEVMTAICEGDADFIYTDECTFRETPEDGFLPHFKPDFAPDDLLANNYICHFTVFSRGLLEKVGGFRSEFDGSQDHDFVLRATSEAACIAHIPEVLYFWRAHSGSVASGADAKPYASQSGIAAVRAQLERLHRGGSVSSLSICPTMYRVSYELEARPLISILIPSCEHQSDLRKCIESIYRETTYDNFEIVIIENNSRAPETFFYYELLQRAHDNLKVVTREGSFNFSAICNFGVRHCSGEVLLFLNNDTEVISPNWLEEMLMYAQRPDVGAVGAKLLYPDGTIQHAGVLIGGGGNASHFFGDFPGDEIGYMGRTHYAQNKTAVTAACLMLRRDAFEAVGGFEEKLAVAYSDVDLCMKLRRKGYLNIWTPNAQLYHYESKSRGSDLTPENRDRFEQEQSLFQERNQVELAYGDPYYNPNLNLHCRSLYCFLPVLTQQRARYTRVVRTSFSGPGGAV